MTPDALVIGGGIVGASVAYHLVKHGLKTHLVDRLDPGNATYAGAGILSPQTSNHPSDDWYRFGVRAVAAYPVMVAALENEQDTDPGYGRCGLLRVAVTDDERAPYADTHALAFQRWERHPEAQTDPLRDVTSDEAQSLLPVLAPVQDAFYNPGAARVDGHALRGALLKAAEFAGLVRQNASAERLLIENGQVVGAVVDGEEVRAGTVAIAGGAWSPVFGEQLGVKIPVAPQRGQIIHLHLSDTDTANWPIVDAFHGHYILAREGGRIVAGATRETGSGFALNTTLSGLHDVMGEVLRVAPGLADAEVVDIRVGLRPLTPDKLPVLGTVPGVDGLFLATGHGPTGLQLGPYSGACIADMIAGQEITDDLTPFSIMRFE